MHARNTFKAVALSAAVLVGGCAAQEQAEAPQALEPVKAEVSPPLPEGTYQVQSVSYDDATGAYTVFLLDPPAGHKPTYTTTEMKMARIDEAGLAEGKKSHLVVDGSGPSLLLTPDFQIAFTHNVMEERVDPATGQRDVVVVRQESTMWSPFMSAMAGAAIGNMLFAPRYYYPPPYAAGGLAGYGGVGDTRAAAGQAYQQRHGSLPQSAKLQATGTVPKKAPAGSLRSSGMGAGSSRLKQSDGVKPPTRSKSFGFGGRRRR